MPKNFSGKILARFMSKSELADFTSKYDANRLYGGRTKEATPQDFKILEAYKSGITDMKELTKKFNTTRGRIQFSLLRASLATI
jgi:hypothetical protein